MSLTGDTTVAALAPAVDAVRLSLHVVAAAIWVGGQIVVAGLLPTLRRLGKDVPRVVARAFARISWPAYGLLLATGFWNVAEEAKGQTYAWKVVLVAKIGVVVVAGLASWLHTTVRSRAATAAWGGVAGLASVAALVMGVVLAG
jgi:putative copper export protein